MNARNRLGLELVATCVAMVGLVPALGLAGQGNGLPQDWSHRHLIVSNPAALEEEVLWTQSPEAWWGLVNDPRFVAAEVRSEAAAAAQARKDAKKAAKSEVTATAPTSAQATRLAASAKKPPPPPPPPLGEGDWSMNLGSGAKVGAGQYPAKYGFSIGTASCSDFVVFNTGLTGTATQASIIAYTNLYSGCSANGSVPSVKWQYNTGGGLIPTSVVLSLDGSQVAFVQTSGGTASLVLLKPGASGTLTTLTAVADSAYRACSAPCMTTLSLGANVTRSAPFVDYTNDVLYIGNNNGVLKKFQNIFNTGTPATVWSQTLAVGTTLTSPVYDFLSGNVFVGASNGILYRIPSGGGSNNIANSGALAQGTGIADAPVVDSQAGKVYVFVYCDTAGQCNNGNRSNAAVYQLPSTGTLTSTKQSLGVSTGNGAGGILFAGSFDAAYLNSTQATPSGNLYVCGVSNGGNNDDRPTLYKVPITSNVLGSPTTGPTLTTANTGCSPVTELYDGTTDRIFLSVQGNQLTGTGWCSASSPAGCIMSFDNPGTGFGAGKTPTAAKPSAGGTSGIIIDNTATSPAGASTLYYSTLANESCTTSSTTGGCAVQRLQSNLN